MITSTFGRLFLDAYNEKYGTQYDARTFFIEQYWPLFFDHNKYLMWPQNSPFVQMKKGQKVNSLTTVERRAKLDEFMEKIDRGAKDASIALGYPASEEEGFATASGQVTNIDFQISHDDVIYSWLGAALAIDVEGGLSIIFDNAEILLSIFEGLKLYREYLNNNDKLKGNQVRQWNGLWISHRYDDIAYNPLQPNEGFSPLVNDGTDFAIAKISWTKLLVPIACSFSKPQMMGYIFSFFNKDKMNSTIGFIPFALHPIKRTKQLYIQLFGMEEYRQAEILFGTAEGLKKNCQAGIIGLKALEPKGLAEYIKKGKRPKQNDIDKDKVKFHTYIIWILAMLNNQELWDKAQTIASALKAYSDAGGKSTKNRNTVDTVLGATNKRGFIEGLTEVVKNSVDNEAFVEAAKEVNTMPTDNVPYFLTLIRFQYATLK